MKHALIITIATLSAQFCHAGEAREKFASITQELTELIQVEYTNAVITLNDKSFKAEFDTMVYSVHGGYKTGEFNPKPRQITGPRAHGFVIMLSVQTNRPGAALFDRGTSQQHYWQELYWRGHRDTEELVYFRLKHGSQIDAHLKNRVIEIVTGTDWQHPVRIISGNVPKGFQAVTNAHFSVSIPPGWSVNLLSEETNQWSYAFLDGTRCLFKASVVTGTDFQGCFCAPWDKYRIIEGVHEEVRILRMDEDSCTYKVGGVSYSLDIHASHKGYDKELIDRMLSSIRMQIEKSEKRSESPTDNAQP